MRARMLSLALIALFTACLGAGARRDYTGLSIPYPILIALADIQREFSIETVLCLEGFVDGRGMVVVHTMRPPIITSRSAEHVQYEGCTSKETVAWYHNHPTPDTTMHYCTPSQADVFVLEARGAYHAMLLTCARGRFVYRFRGDSVNYMLPAALHIAPWDSVTP